ncbi:hypothetical protein [Albibacterium indicum]|uniref:hypothetical protein n=1 Tax=Albibacterium indicum TaxID=2292082 RepID=UPI000E54346A|nr:hypothetical protein [Pedobacter indicus]
MQKITPLNIVVAILIVWAISELVDGALVGSQLIWIGVLAVIIIVVDIMFRMMLDTPKRIWLIQLVFLVLTLIVAFGIWHFKN